MSVLMKNEQMIAGLVPNEEIESANVTTGQGQSININFRKWGKVVFMRIANGSYTADANVAFATIPSGFRPIFTSDTRDTYSNKRLQFDPSGDMRCTESLTNTTLRGSVCWLTNE